METLSQELIDQITSYLRDDELKQVLTVSKAFQCSAERLLLEKFNLKKDNADHFLQLYSSSRVRYLRKVEFLPTFPMVNRSAFNEEKGCREQLHDLREKDELFTQQMIFLFETLKSFEDRVRIGRFTPRIRLTIFPPRRAVDWPCRHRDCVCWRVHLLSPEKLPRLFSICDLQLKDGGYFSPLNQNHRNPESVSYQAPSKLDLRILVDLACRLPNLEYLKAKLKSVDEGVHSARDFHRHYVKDWPGPHRDTRHDFAKAVESSTLPSSLRCVSFHFHNRNRERSRDQRDKLPNFVSPRQYDPFSTSLRVLSQQMDTMILQARIDHTFFSSADGSTPNWPNLRYLEIEFLNDSPSGAEYFQGPRGEGFNASIGYEITDEHYEPMEYNATDDRYHCGFDFDPYVTKTHTQFRIVPIERNLRPFVASFAKAAANMPLLRKAALWTYIPFDPEDAYEGYEEFLDEMERTSGGGFLRWGIAYAKPGEYVALAGIDQKECATRQFWWMTQYWRPDEELLSSVHEIGRMEHGDEEVHYWGSDYEHRFGSRAPRALFETQ